MATQDEQNIVKEARPGKGAAGDQQAVQVAQPVGSAVNPPDTDPMPGGDVEDNIETIKAAEASESDTDMKTTDGYVVDESGRLDNFAVEPEMYVEGEK
ncbi:MAG: hypothetical protein F6J97_12060 [Leptolyngbya sp. SIO4C1]|nr:hypothetical protein [Leptolyngbya sp. SIO4C1]